MTRDGTNLFDDLSDALLLVLGDVCLEAGRAAGRYGAFRSTHEALGVLTEEVAELAEEIRRNALENVRAEAIQVAAVALRLAEACRDDDAFKGRSGC